MKPYLFLHIPKTGGSSISNILPTGRCSINNFFQNNKNNNDMQNYGYAAPRHHYTLEQYGKIGLIDCDKLYKFTFVRNPWDRVVSIFHDWKAQNSQNARGGIKYMDEHFSNFVEYVLTPALDSSVKQYAPIMLNARYSELTLGEQAMFDNLRQDHANTTYKNIQPREGCSFYYTAANGHYTPQVKYTHDNSNKQVVQFIGRFENLQDDYNRLSEICGWQSQPSAIPHLNRSERAKKDYRRYYEDGSGLAKHLVSEIYREDIEIYGYTF